MRLSDLLTNLTKNSSQFTDVTVSTITDRTSEIRENCVFVCIKGNSFDGHSAAAEAIQKGAALVVCERDMGIERQLVVENSRAFYAELCAEWWGHPERKIKMVGVTGTNGKTTITTLIKHILVQNGHKVGLIGTIQNEIGDEVVYTGNTTPMPFEFMELLDRMVRAGCDICIMEVSSFALVQYRIGPTRFRIAAFTNLTQDHLDYHGTMEEYYQAKKKLFGICDSAIINTDDEYGKRLFDEISCRKYSVSIKDKADFYADVIKIRPSETSFWICAEGKTFPVAMKLTGSFNVSNAVQAIACCTKLGLSTEKVITALSECTGVKGRCEIIPTGRDFTVICDYAHTPDAVENILSSVKEYTENRLICLFGCGGNRDSTKRPLMAKAAAKFADYLVVTSDNPRNEEPSEIIKDILTGLDGTTIPYTVVEDRRDAIYFSIKNAEKGDIIVLAGKGHEDYQILKDDVHIHFDEREVVADALREIYN